MDPQEPDTPQEAPPPARLARNPRSLARIPATRKRPAPSAKPENASQLPQRRWAIRAPRAMVPAVLGAVVGVLVPFLAWWFLGYPLWWMLFALPLGWFALLPSPLLLGLDERGMALIVAGWGGTKYLWIPQDRLTRLQLSKGWLIATGANVEQQGEFDVSEAARQAGASIPTWLNLQSNFALSAAQIAAPVYLLDQLARDEIELWLYRQGK